MLTPRRSPVLAALLILLCVAAARAAVPHVVQISVDGLNAKLLHQYMQQAPADFPGFGRFVEEGATTFNARADFTHTITLPNHTCMVTGRPVRPPAGQPGSVAHDWTWNSNPKPGDTLQNSNPATPYIASTFDVAHDAGLSTAIYSAKGKFTLFTTSFDAQHGRIAFPPGHGRNKIDHFYIEEAKTSDVVESHVLADLARYHTAYTFLHYREPDTAGHAHGWGSAKYRTAVKNVDGFLAKLMSFLSTDPEFKGRTVVILTADHGGLPGTRGHSNPTKPDDYTIPFFAWGPGVARHADLYQLNTATRQDPGDGRPDYNAPVQPIRNGGAGNLALKLLGLPAIPDSTINAKQDLAVE